MIKVTFKEPEDVLFNGALARCLFVLATCAAIVEDKDIMPYYRVFRDGDSNLTIPTKVVKSIEHVKPTDL